MKNLFYYLGIGLVFSLTSCQKEIEETTNNTELSKSNVADNVEVQKIIIEGDTYVVHVGFDIEKDSLFMLEAPAEVLGFFEDYGLTFIPHVILGSDTTVVYYYKNDEDFSSHVRFLDSPENRPKSYRGATTKAWEHGYNSGWSISDLYENYSSFEIAPTSVNPVSPASQWQWFNAWGKNQPWIGNGYNDRVSLIEITLTSLEPTSYIGFEDINFGGRRIVITKNTQTLYNRTSLGKYAFTNGILDWRTWNDKISSYKTFQTNVLINGYPI